MFGPGLFIFGFLIPLAAVVLAAYGIWELVRSREGSASGGVQASPASGSARAILDERFARGEIDVDEYTSRRALLDGGPQPPLAPQSAAVQTTEPQSATQEAPAPEPVTSMVTEPVEAVVNGEDAAVME